MAERGIHDISPFRITNYTPHSRAALTSVPAIGDVAEVKPDAGDLGYHPTFVRVHPTDGDLVIEVGDPETNPATPGAGSHRIYNNKPEWVQIPFKGWLEASGVSGATDTSFVWAG